MVSTTESESKRATDNPEPESHEESETVETLRNELIELKKSRQESERKAAEYFDKLQRLQAEMENLQKITRRQIESITNQASREIAEKLLPFLDALRQARRFAHEGKPLPSEEIAVGLDMLYAQLMETLRTVGLEEIEAVGQVLDPEKHEVVSYDERADAKENSVVEEIRKGYTLNGKVIRPSMVVVAKPKGAESVKDSP